jgi:hypothetical protein
MRELQINNFREPPNPLSSSYQNPLHFQKDRYVRTCVHASRYLRKVWHPGRAPAVRSKFRSRRSVGLVVIRGIDERAPPRRGHLQQGPRRRVWPHHTTPHHTTHRWWCRGEWVRPGIIGGAPHTHTPGWMIIWNGMNGTDEAGGPSNHPKASRWRRFVSQQCR